MIRALVFDFDGLILDTETPELMAWQETFAEHGCELTLEVWVDSIGRPPGSFDPCRHLAELARREIDLEFVREQTRVRARKAVWSQPLLPGVEELVMEARSAGMRVGIASSSSLGWVRGHLERFGIDDAFDAMVCREDTTRHKPDPAPYRAILEKLDVSSHEAIALEDSPHGLAAARAAGMICVAVPNQVTRQVPLSSAHLRFESLAEISLARLVRQAEVLRTSL